MDSSNHWYGHAHILGQYCGHAGDPPPIEGIVQHGWTFVHGFGYGHQPPIGYTRLVWSDVCRRRGQLVGWRQYLPIGAPFAYLLETEPAPADAAPREGTIWYPFHGTADYETVEGNHQRLIDEIKATEDGPVTMCLYYVEYDQPEIRQRYEDVGFRVICHGTRGTKWAGATTSFLHTQLAELRAHKRVASNRLSTAIFHGIAAGCEGAVYGDPMDFVGVKDGFDGQHLLEATFPELHGTELDPVAARETVHREMGVNALLSPEELSIALGWTK